MPRLRRFNASMAAVAIAGGVAQVLTGSAELALTFAPLLLIAGLLISGRYLGEERILARRPRPLAAPRRRLAARWRPVVERPPTSLLARSPRSERGPPAVLAPAA
jgi:hypothetical protein